MASHVFLDGHQDAVGTALCGEGVPQWFSALATPGEIGKPLYPLPKQKDGKCGTDDTQGWAAHAGEDDYNTKNACCLRYNQGMGSEPNIVKSLSPFFKGAKSGFKMCFLPASAGAGGETRLDSRINKYLNSISVMDLGRVWVAAMAAAWVVCGSRQWLQLGSCVGRGNVQLGSCVGRGNGCSLGRVWVAAMAAAWVVCGSRQCKLGSCVGRGNVPSLGRVWVAAMAAVWVVCGSRQWLQLGCLRAAVWQLPSALLLNRFNA